MKKKPPYRMKTAKTDLIKMRAGRDDSLPGAHLYMRIISAHYSHRTAFPAFSVAGILISL